MKKLILFILSIVVLFFTFVSLDYLSATVKYVDLAPTAVLYGIEPNQSRKIHSPKSFKQLTSDIETARETLKANNASLITDYQLAANRVIYYDDATKSKLEALNVHTNSLIEMEAKDDLTDDQLVNLHNELETNYNELSSLQTEFCTEVGHGGLVEDINGTMITTEYVYYNDDCSIQTYYYYYHGDESNSERFSTFYTPDTFDAVNNSFVKGNAPIGSLEYIVTYDETGFPSTISYNKYMGNFTTYSSSGQLLNFYEHVITIEGFNETADINGVYYYYYF